MHNAVSNPGVLSQAVTQCGEFHSVFSVRLLYQKALYKGTNGDEEGPGASVTATTQCVRAAKLSNDMQDVIWKTAQWEGNDANCCLSAAALGMMCYKQEHS